MPDPSVASAIRRVQDAAIDRALVGDESRRHLAFAGALEPVRREPTSADPVLAALFASLLAHHGVDTFLEAAPSVDVLEATPSLGPVVDAERDESDPTAVGAALAVRRFHAEPSAVAELADVSIATIDRRIRMLPE